jgi:hypothetical protein
MASLCLPSKKMLLGTTIMSQSELLMPMHILPKLMLLCPCMIILRPSLKIFCKSSTTNRQCIRNILSVKLLDI